MPLHRVTTAAQLIWLGAIGSDRSHMFSGLNLSQKFTHHRRWGRDSFSRQAMIPAPVCPVTTAQFPGKVRA